jgi:hypothetical protein
MITKAHVLGEVVRTAKTNGGVPLGRQNFYTETGIKEIDWIGEHRARWGDATTAWRGRLEFQRGGWQWHCRVGRERLNEEPAAGHSPSP